MKNLLFPLISIICIVTAIAANANPYSLLYKELEDNVTDATVTAVKDTGTTVPFDTISYAMGHQCTLGIMDGENKLMQKKNDFEDYVRALNDFLPDDTAEKDSSYVMSYMLGGMQGIFSTDGRSREEMAADFPCVIKGLRKVANGTIVLPDDTIQALAVIKRYTPANTRELKGDARCEYLTAIGTMKAFAPGLQEYLDEMAPGMGLVANRQAFMAGMADMLELASMGDPNSAYGFGKIIAGTIKYEFSKSGNFQTINKQSFIAGAKAALHLEEELIPREAAKRIFEKRMADDQETEDTGLQDEQFAKYSDYGDKLNVELDTQYTVNWYVEATPVASANSLEAQTFSDFLNKHLPDATVIPGTLMAVGADYNSESLYQKITSSIAETPLKEGFKWFCALNADSALTVGIMQTDGVFKAIVHEASIEFNSHFGSFYLLWKYDKGTAALWSQFTEDHIGKCVALKINGRFIMAPRVHNQITNGACAAHDVLPEIVNNLFQDAVPFYEEIPVEVEAIEIN